MLLLPIYVSCFSHEDIPFGERVAALPEIPSSHCECTCSSPPRPAQVKGQHQPPICIDNTSANLGSETVGKVETSGLSILALLSVQIEQLLCVNLLAQL